MVVISSIADVTARSTLERLFDLLALQPRRGREGSDGWVKATSWTDRPLLPFLASALDSQQMTPPPAESRRGGEEAVAFTALSPSVIGPVPRPRVPIGPSLPPNRPVIGPSLPPVPSSPPPPTSTSSAVSEDDVEDALGPVPVSSLTAAEAAALVDLQRARRQAAETREALATLRAQRQSSSSHHEEWMTAAPVGLKGQAALLAAMSGDQAMKPRGFSARGLTEGGDSAEWTASPEEREWLRVEREAERGADKAVNRAIAARAGTLTTQREAVVVAAKPTASAEPSLLSLHQQAMQGSGRGGGSAVSRVGPIFWDREKEMGMRRQKTSQQITAELKGAAALNDRFASSTT